MTLTSDLRTHLRALRSLAHRANRDRNAGDLNQSLGARLLDVFVRTWDLGFTAFGGPAVHFQILYARFVVGGSGSGEKWIDEQTYQDLFAICQALPGPGSTKMLFCIALFRAGVIPAVMVFFLWSLPAAIAMFGLSLGVQRVSEILPSPVYALLSGLNASTVGVVALAAVQLADKAIKDQWTRILVIFGACAGMCYNALWYFPVLVLAGGVATTAWDEWAKHRIASWRARRERRRRRASEEEEMPEVPATVIDAPQPAHTSQTGLVQRKTADQQQQTSPPSSAERPSSDRHSTPPISPASHDGTQNLHKIRVRVGLALVVGFSLSFIAIMVLRGVLNPLPRILALFANMYLAGTVIFGGGPVVIPLLRSYVVDPGWVSSRDFLLGLAIIQAMPGPNFNFAVYLGALAVQSTSAPTVIGALLGFIGIFLPGLLLAVAVQSFWQALRSRAWVVNLLRGINATAVGLVFTAVYRLWEIGYLTPEESRGKSLASEPWWVVVAAVTYAECAWFGVQPAVAIVLGAVLGLAWWGATQT